MALEIIAVLASILFGMYVHLNYFGASVAIALPYRRHKNAEKSVAKWPKVSAIISAKNEEAVIGRTLKALRESGYPRLEIILADASTDNTRKIATKYADKIITDDGKGKPAAANKAAKAAKGEVLYFLDADSVVRPGSLQKLVSMLDEKTAAAVGISVPRNKGTITSRAARLQYAHFSAMQPVGMRVLKSPVIAGKNFAIWKKDLFAVGGFDNVLTEDVNLTYKLKKAGKRIEFNPDAVTVEAVPEKLGHYLRQQERWYRGSFSEIRKGLRNARKRQVFSTPVGVLTMFSPGFVFLFAMLWLATGSWFFLSAALLGYLMKIVAAAKYLELGDVIFSPVSYAVLCTVQFGVLCWCALKKMAGRSTEWYKTPKAD
jgi:cellulose synthase/poly-beta-1,6-N-acetylglucosamine synthase-like glycosyltransferase